MRCDSYNYTYTRKDTSAWGQETYMAQMLSANKCSCHQPSQNAAVWNNGWKKALKKSTRLQQPKIQTA